MPATADEIERTAKALREECRRLLAETRLLPLLAEYGTPHLTGSFVLDLMVWRDLDIELIAEDLTVERFFDLGREIAARLGPARMSFRNERIMRTEGLPVGLYWGVHQHGDRGWKIDLWALDKAEHDRRSSYAAWVQSRLTPESRRTVLAIKSAVWHDPQFRQVYSSKHIYDAVLGEYIVGVGEFIAYLESKGVLQP